MPGVPIIMLTMYQELLGSSLLSATGVKAVVAKTDGLVKLVACVKSLLGSRSHSTAPCPNSNRIIRPRIRFCTMPSFPIREGHRSKRNLFKQRASPVVNLDRKHKRLPCLVLDSSKGGFRLRGSFLVRICFLIGFVYCMYLAGKRGISAWYLRQSSAAALESAIAWDAANPQNFDDLGTLIHTYGDGGDPERIIQSYQTATRLSPQNAQYWADLGAAYDWAGRQNEAIGAFHRALKLFPNSPYINWRVANFCIRTGKTREGFQSLRKVLLGGGVPRRDVFALAARA